MAQDPHINPATGVWDDNYYAKTHGGGSGGVNIPAFNFDFNQAEADARAKLEPYYRQKLADAKGDIEKAKLLIQQDYDNGIRGTNEELGIQTQQDQAQGLQETQNLLGDLNKRGVLFGQIQGQGSAAPMSQYAQSQEINPLQQKQELRKKAIELAIRRQQEAIGTQYQKAIQAPSMDYGRTEQDLLEQKENEVQTKYVPLAEQQARDKYDATAGQAMNQQINEHLSSNKYLQMLGF
jgi:hypothetical protein